MSTPWGDALLTPPTSTLPSLFANSYGIASTSISVPIGACGRTIWMQALDYDFGLLSNGLDETVGGACGPPVVGSIVPDKADRDQTITVNIFGENLLDGCELTLHQGSTTINGSGEIVNGTTSLDSTIDLNGAPLGLYDVKVINPGGQSDTKYQAFEVTDPSSNKAILSIEDGTANPVLSLDFGSVQACTGDPSIQVRVYNRSATFTMDNWFATANQAWLYVDPNQGIDLGPGQYATASIKVNGDELAKLLGQGQQSGKVTFAANDLASSTPATNSPWVISVTATPATGSGSPILQLWDDDGRHRTKGTVIDNDSIDFQTVSGSQYYGLEIANINQCGTYMTWTATDDSPYGYLKYTSSSGNGVAPGGAGENVFYFNLTNTPAGTHTATVTISSSGGGSSWFKIVWTKL